MRSADAAGYALAAALLIFGGAHAAETQYGKVETFEPGKKYTCLPTADRKGWDCREAASKDASASARPAEPAPGPAAATPPPPPPSPAAASPTSPASAAAMPSQPSSDAAASPTGRNSGLPSYLRAPGAVAPSTTKPPPVVQPETRPEAAVALPESPPKAAPAPTVGPQAPSQTLDAQSAAAPPAAARSTTAQDRAPATTTTPTTSPPHDAAGDEPAAREAAGVEKPAPSPTPREADISQQKTAAAEPAPAPAETNHPTATAPESPRSAMKPAASTTASATGSGGNIDFLALPGSAYIVELAHGANKSELDALRTSLRPAHGELYELHLLRDGADWWLLVWGTFDSVDAARAARNELSSDTLLNAGWPRPVAPLQKEARRVAE